MKDKQVSRSGRASRACVCDRIGQLNVNLQDKLRGFGGKRDPVVKTTKTGAPTLPKRGIVYNKDASHCAYVYDGFFFDPNDYNALFVLPGGNIDSGPFGPFEPNGFHLPPYSTLNRPLKDRKQCLNAVSEYGACFVLVECIGNFLKSEGTLTSKIDALKTISGKDLINMYFTL